ncbi:SHOCT domain-containing protein [Cellulomonas sp. URHD0024]|uniref:SHOCT domain-containing protein n=1 Tax=Cellulomonas sp. URHD0024 TaxID=1302620 RepID=UPI00041CD390|nr:SHOCT domain-containing protein [Cellulomonas sp. URHD0024]
MPGLIRGVARTAVVAGTATAVSNRVSRRQAGRWNDQAQQQAAPPPPQYAEPQYAPPPPPPPVYAAPAAAAPADMDAKLAQLSQLGALRDAGVLSDIEFEVQKNKILSA